MPNKVELPRLVYWDSCVFIHLLEGTKDKKPVIEALMASADSGSMRIITSIHSITEVAKVKQETSEKKLSKQAENKIGNLWHPTSIFELSDYHLGIAYEAMGLIRAAVPFGLSLKPSDAVHLSTAVFLSADEIHTYDEKLRNPEYAKLTGIKIVEPYSDELPFDGGIGSLPTKKKKKPPRKVI